MAVSKLEISTRKENACVQSVCRVALALVVHTSWGNEKSTSRLMTEFPDDRERQK